MYLVNSFISYADVGLFLLRLTIAFIFMYHALPKVEDPIGVAIKMGHKFKSPMVLIMGLIELLAGFSLILGVYTGFFSALLGMMMFAAIILKIFVWDVDFAEKDKTGWEFDLILLVACTMIFLSGPGLISV